MGSLARKLLAGSLAVTAVAVASIVGLTLLFAYVRREFAADVLASTQEQRAADDITTSVYGQLIAAYRQSQDPTPENVQRFDSLGSIAFERLREYLQRQMTTEERLQVEDIKDLHQSMEVDAHTAIELVRQGDSRGARARLGEMETKLRQLQLLMDRFVSLREADRKRRLDEQGTDMQQWVALLGLGIVVLTAASLLFVRSVRRQVVGPLAQISDTVTRFGFGDLTVRVPAQQHDEFATVAQSFNEMADRIRDANAARERSQLRYRRLFDEAPIALYRTSLSGILLDANPAFVSLLGYRDVSDIVGKPVQPLYVHQEQRDEFIHAMSEYGAIHEQSIELRRSTGETILVVDTTHRVSDPETGEVYNEGGLIDVTQRRRAEDALRESEQRFREMAEHIKEAFFVVDLTEQRTLYLSPTWAEIWGRPLSDGYKPEIWLDAVHPDDRKISAASREKIRQGLADESVFRIIRPDNSVRWVRGRAFPVRNSAGLVHRMVGVSEDITELRQAEESLTQAQKMEAVGRLAGGVAHDFNNLLTVIIAEAELLQATVASGSPEAEGLREIRRASDSAVTLTQQLLTFSRKQFVEPVVFNLGEVVAETGKMLRRLIGEDIELELRLLTDASIRADQSQIQQVLTNLAVNARDAMPNGGVLALETRTVAVTPANRSAYPELDIGHYVMLSVRDTGSGMTPEVAARVFEPFFTTKERGKGTGLGLATSHGIVKKAGGSIEIESELNVGTTFRLYFPRVNATPALGTPLVRPAVPMGTETILMVEDDPGVRRVGARILRAQGYQVVEMGDPTEALTFLDGNPQVIHLLFTDVVLPKMGGRELADRAVLKRPELRVLYTSGYTDDVILQHRIAEEGTQLVQKPYSRDSLLAKVRAALDASQVRRAPPATD